MEEESIKLKKTILAFENQLIKNIQPLILEKLKAKYKVILVVKTTEDKKFYLNKYKNCFDQIIVYVNEFEILKKNISEKLTEKKAIQFESKLDKSLYRIFLAERVIGRGYFSSGGFRHPRNRLHYENSHLQMLKLGVAKLDFWESFFKKENIFLAINLPNPGHLIAKFYNVKSKRIIIGKFENTLAWSSDLYLQPDNLYKDFNKIKAKTFKRVLLKSPFKGHIQIRKQDIKAQKISTCIKDSVLGVARRVYGNLRNYRKTKNSYLLDELIYIWKRRGDFFKLKKKESVSKKDLKNLKYVFFPMVAEPEVALHGTAQDFFFQLSAINMISRDLPADYILLVKEHLLAVGRRPDNFYEQIHDLKNVKFANSLDHGLDYVKNAKIVACITGTAAWEAAVMGIPVISFSKNNIYNFLNHVYCVESPDSTKEIIPKIILKNYPNKESLLDGARFYNAYMKNMININDANLFMSWQNMDKNLENYVAVLTENLLKKN